jgi:2-dehydro-3-deoxyphosphooctonate aldolase (KDO 8-P synthase)
MIRHVTIGNVHVGTGQPLVWIAGPCVIEPNDVTFIVADRLKELADRLDLPLIFKASFDKACAPWTPSNSGPDCP